MKKWFKKRKSIICILLFILGVYLGYQAILKKRVVLHNKEIVSFVLKETFQKPTLIEQVENIYTNKNKVFSLLNKDYEEATTISNNTYVEPIVYLYNSHPTEEYQATTFLEYSLDPTVLLNNYILEDIFNKNGIPTIVEERSAHQILEDNNWNYASSYKASRFLMEDALLKYPSLEYFIDIHRDSVSKDMTTITIDDRDYAKLLFIIGLENENYEENLYFTEKIVSKLDTYYPGISKGIYKKEGPGVNGVYNQDFSSHTILIEIGGYQNTTVEVLNSSIAFSRCMIEVIHEENT